MELESYHGSGFGERYTLDDRERFLDRKFTNT
jgi:hypothetical protein